jgi:hypothetical protein
MLRAERKLGLLLQIASRVFTRRAMPPNKTFELHHPTILPQPAMTFNSQTISSSTTRSRH